MPVQQPTSLVDVRASLWMARQQQQQQQQQQQTASHLLQQQDMLRRRSSSSSSSSSRRSLIRPCRYLMPAHTRPYLVMRRGRRQALWPTQSRDLPQPMPSSSSGSSSL
jgi:hypothetical protein